MSSRENQRQSDKRAQDYQLVVRSSKGDKLAYRLLVEKYQSRVLSIAYGVLGSREDAEDIAQETFVKAYLSLSKFRGDSSFYTWLYRIAFNMAIDFKRKKNRRGGDSAELNTELELQETAQNSELVKPVETPDQVVFRKEKARRIQSVLEELSDTHKTVVLLREVDGLSYDQIAKVVGVSSGTVMSRLHYARKKLQEKLKDLMNINDTSEDNQDSSDSGLSQMNDVNSISVSNIAADKGALK